jgi:hypothetical protein
MQRHRRTIGATATARPLVGLGSALDIARAEIEKINLEISAGRPSGLGIRDELLRLVSDTEDQLAGRPLSLLCNRQHSPAAWIDSILCEAELRSRGIVERHLVGATLQRRHPKIAIPNHPGHAADVQTGRSGDFPLLNVSYHVTATDGREAVDRCKENIGAGIHPVLVLPKRHLVKANAYAEIAGIQNRISIIAIEDFITQNVIEMSTHQRQDFFSTLKAIIDEYNRRLEAVETDMSLKIELS